MKHLLAVLVLLFALFDRPAHARDVVLELLLAVDTSTSVDDTEFALQRDGLASAFAHPDLISIIEGMGSKGIAVSVFEWAGTGSHQTIVDWTLVNSEQSSLQVAARIKRAPRVISGMTDIGSALDYARSSIHYNTFDGVRKVVDVSGDGTSSATGTAKSRDQILADGVVVNGLVIFNKEYDLGELANIELVDHYTQNVIGGPGAFLMQAQNFEDFRDAILRKLIREIIGTSTAQMYDR